MVKRPKWFDTVKVGDVLQTPGGDYRVVREVTRHKSRRIPGRYEIYLTFAIRHCSWTGRGVTTKLGGEVLDWKHTGCRVKLTSKFDQDIAYEAQLWVRGKRRLTCCDVKHAL